MSLNQMKELQIFELKQLADMENAYRQQCRDALQAYRDWLALHDGETDQIEIIYGNLQGQILRRVAEETVKAYWVIRHDFRQWFHRYLANTNYYPSNNN